LTRSFSSLTLPLDGPRLLRLSPALSLPSLTFSRTHTLSGTHFLCVRLAISLSLSLSLTHSMTHSHSFSLLLSLSPTHAPLHSSALPLPPPPPSPFPALPRHTHTNSHAPASRPIALCATGLLPLLRHAGICMNIYRMHIYLGQSE
jgi:hypothetical protein